jgi:toxin CptA
MSIAISAVVRPSRMARVLLLAWTLAQLAAAVAVVFLPMRADAGPWLAALLAGAGLTLAAAAARTPKTHRIDISGAGELRVTVQQGMRAPRPVARLADGNAHAAPLLLLPGSVLWPGLMLLRLGADGGKPRILPIWRDSVDGGAWRALAVALGVIGRPRRSQDQRRDWRQGGCEKNR